MIFACFMASSMVGSALAGRLLAGGSKCAGRGGCGCGRHAWGRSQRRPGAIRRHPSNLQPPRCCPALPCPPHRQVEGGAVHAGGVWPQRRLPLCARLVPASLARGGGEGRRVSASAGPAGGAAPGWPGGAALAARPRRLRHACAGLQRQGWQGLALPARPPGRPSPLPPPAPAAWAASASTARCSWWPSAPSRCWSASSGPP